MKPCHLALPDSLEKTKLAATSPAMSACHVSNLGSWLGCHNFSKFTCFGKKTKHVSRSILSLFHVKKLHQIQDDEHCAVVKVPHRFENFEFWENFWTLDHHIREDWRQFFSPQFSSIHANVLCGEHWKLEALWASFDHRYQRGWTGSYSGWFCT